MKQQLKEISSELGRALDKLPSDNLVGESYLDPIFIDSVLKTFKNLVPEVNKLVHKRLTGQEVLLINPKDYDNIHEYHKYIMDNISSLREAMEDIKKCIDNYIENLN